MKECARKWRLNSGDVACKKPFCHAQDPGAAGLVTILPCLPPRGNTMSLVFFTQKLSCVLIQASCNF